MLNLDDFLSILLKFRVDKNNKQTCKGQGQGSSFSLDEIFHFIWIKAVQCASFFDELSVIRQNKCTHAICMFERKKAELFHCIHSEK